MNSEQYLTAQNYARKIHSMIEKRHPQETFAIPNEKLSMLCLALLERITSDKPLTTAQESALKIIADNNGAIGIEELQVAMKHKNTAITYNVLTVLEKRGDVELNDGQVSLTTN